MTHLELMFSDAPHYIDEESHDFFWYDDTKGFYHIDPKLNFLHSNLMGFLWKSHDDSKVKDDQEGYRWVDKLDEYQIKKIVKKYTLGMIMRQQFVDRKSMNKFSYLSEKQEKIILNCKNTSLEINIKTGGIKEIGFNSEHLFTTSLDVSYNPDKTCELFIESINEIIPRPPDVEKIRHYIAYSMINDYFDWEIALLLYGARAHNGKSTLMDTIGNLFTTVCATSLIQLADKFGREPAYHADFLIADESDLSFNDFSAIKKTITGENQLIDMKNIKAISDFINAKMIIACNTLPSILVHDRGLQRRFEIIEAPRNFEETDNTSLKRSMNNEEIKSGILNWVLPCFKSLFENIGEYKKGIAQRTLNFYENHSSPFGSFSNLYMKSEDKVGIDELLKAYNFFAMKNQHKDFTKNKVVIELKKVFGDDYSRKRGRSQIAEGATTFYEGIGLDYVALDESLEGWRGYEQPSTDHFADYYSDPEETTDGGGFRLDKLVTNMKELFETKKVEFIDKEYFQSIAEGFGFVDSWETVLTQLCRDGIMSQPKDGKFRMVFS